MRVSTALLFVMTLACTSNPGDDGGGEDDTDTDTAPIDDRHWPEDTWDEGAPGDYGLNADDLEAVREYAFRPEFSTQSVIVIKDGVLVAEWYEEGTDADSLITTWSAGKSVMSALFGVGLRESVLTLDDTIGLTIPEWSTGPNAALTNRHLLEMRSGLPANTSNSYGVYAAEPDQLAYSLDRTPVDEPGKTFSYINEDSMVLGEVLTQAFGEPVADVAEQEIFEPLGIDAVWWTDGAGHALTYCCIDTTARDFVRFGLLFARNGEWKGTQIVPEDYVKESTTGISNYGYYGMQWWSFGDFFGALGYHGQYVYVHPDLDLVVARFGKYTKHGSQSVRVGANYHETVDPGAFDAETFVALYLAALTDD